MHNDTQVLPGSGIRIEFLQQRTPQAIHDIQQLLVRELWKQDWSEARAREIFEWRYSKLHADEIVLAYDDDRLVAMITAYLRQYRINQELIYIGEPSDWFCLPEYRPTGLGVQVMSAVMQRSEPLLAIGGSSEAKALFPALGWHPPRSISTYTLPLTTRFLVSKASRLLHLPIGVSFSSRPGDKPSSALPAFPQRHDTWPCRRLEPSDLSNALTSPAKSYTVEPLMSSEELEWLYAAPQDLGTFFGLAFVEETGVSAFAVGRLYFHQQLKYAKLIHLQASSPSVEAYTRMLAETVHYASDHHADAMQCRASSPLLQKALARIGFVWSGSHPAFCWSKTGNPIQGDCHLTYLRGDDGIRPYPE